MSRVQLIALSEELKQALACTEAEQDLAQALADLVFADAVEGVRPTVYLELAARILATTAQHAFAAHNRTAARAIDPSIGAAAVFSFALDRASRLLSKS